MATVPDGLSLRGATAADGDQLARLASEVFSPADVPWLRAELAEPGGPARWTVVADADGTVVAACELLGQRLADVDGVSVPFGQVEWVMTSETWRRRGLIRAQIDRHHHSSAERGDLLTVIAGIPYFYRRFGYGYGLSWPRSHVVPTQLADGPDDDVAVREAGADDVAALLAWEHDRPSGDVHVVRRETDWAAVVARCAAGPTVALRLAEADGVLEGWGITEAPPDDTAYAFPATARTDRAAHTLLHAARDHAGDHELVAMAGRGPWGALLGRTCPVIDDDQGVYVRIPDPVALVDHLRPLLSRRLTAAGRPEAGVLDLSLYDRTVRLHLEPGEVVGVEEGPVLEDPFDSHDVGVAPDWLPALVLGRWGARELARRCDDVTLGRHAELMEALFPALPSDVASDL